MSRVAEREGFRASLFDKLITPLGNPRFPNLPTRETTVSLPLPCSNPSASNCYIIHGGESGIRTHDPREGTPVFKTGAFNRSAISPKNFTKYPFQRNSSNKVIHASRLRSRHSTHFKTWLYPEHS